MTLQDAYPLTALQTGMLFHSELEPGSATYHDVFTLTIRGPYSRAKLEAVLADVAARHPVLRTSFNLTDFSEPLQLVHSAVSIPFEEHTDGGGLAEWREREKHRPFDYRTPPLLRVAVHLLGDGVFALTFSFHHAILDGWSVASLTTEVLRRYAGEALPLDPPASQFRDFVAAEREAAESAATKDFWRGVTGDAPVSELPVLPGASVRGELDVRVDATVLPAEVVTGLHDVARELRVPLRTVLLAAHLRVLGLMSGSDDVVTGTVTHGRPETESGDEVLGLFLNTVPVRVHIDAPDWATLVRRTFEAELDLLPHRLYPLFNIQHDAGGRPVFTTLFDFHDFHVYRGTAGQRELELLDFDFFEQTNLPFAAYVLRSANGLTLQLKYDSLRYDRIDDVRAQYVRALTDLATGGPVRRPVEFAPPYEPASYPDSFALWDDPRVRRLARRLCERGVGADVVVGVCMERGVELLVAVHAILMAGGAYLPIEPSLPVARRELMAGRAAFVLTDVADVSEDDSPLEGRAHPDSLAYVIFTSGSTGVPKGVGVSRRAIANRLHWMQSVFPLARGERVLFKTPFSFDVSVWELLWPAMVGAVSVVAPPELHRDPEGLARFIEAERVTTVHFVPSMLDAFLDVEPPACLRRIICSGEALSAALADRCLERIPWAELHNLYGPTEAAVDVSWHRCRGGESVVPIGRPVANTRLEVLDAHMRRVPVGVPGELFLGGVQLARGYVGRPGLTAQRFVPAANGERLYRTGDVARWLPSGEVEYLGRTDRQVKVRGLRIELGEIEAALSTLAGVKSAVVTQRRQTLAAYVVAESEPDGWRQALLRTLPDYMVPATLTLLETLPTTANGKLDLAALPDPVAAARKEGTWAPRDATETRIATIWQDLLSLDSVSIDENFFELGGHSLLALRLTMRMRQEFGLELPIAAVLSAPTIAELAEIVRSPSSLDQNRPVIALRSSGNRPAFFAFHALGGQVFRYQPLARRLGADQPVYAVPAKGFALGEEPHSTLEEMTWDYSQSIQSVPYKGSYVLGGFCIGGNIALETARRLRAAGADVPLVILIWSSADQPVVRESLEDDNALMVHALAGASMVDVDLEGLSPDEKLLRVIHASKAADRLPPDMADLDQARRFLKVFRANAHATGWHKHEPYDGNVVLLLPSEDEDVAPDEDFGWRDVITGEFHIGRIPGNRLTAFFEPQVAGMAAEIRKWMDHGLR